MLKFEWDPAKAKTNERKHGIFFEDAMFVFEDPYAVFEPDDRLYTGEQRWHVVGIARGIAVLLVVHTVSDEVTDEVIRIISARQASKKERAIYEQARTQGLY